MPYGSASPPGKEENHFFIAPAAYLAATLAGNSTFSLTAVLIWYYKGTGGDDMKIAQDIKPVTYLKSRAADLLKQINETHRPVIITQNGEPRAILQDPKSYENMRNAIGILKLISQGEEQVREGKFRSQQEVFENIETFLKDKTG
jgi:prevent-host-death family protein